MSITLKRRQKIVQVIKTNYRRNKINELEAKVVTGWTFNELHCLLSNNSKHVGNV